eukprot:9466720-Pyramimonas_sp.AAC.2
MNRKGLWGVESTLAVIGTGGPIDEQMHKSTNEYIEELVNKISQPELTDVGIFQGSANQSLHM